MRITLSGYYGLGNTGDEAILAGIAESFRTRSASEPIELTVLSANPRDTERRHSLQAVDRMNAPAVKAVIKKSDLLVSGGGSLLQDVTSLRSLIYYLWVIRTALRRSVPVMFYAQGIGPLRRTISRLLTRMAANGAQHITVRDADSATLLRKIGVTRPPIDVTADPAFALSQADSSITESHIKALNLSPDEPMAGFAPRPWIGGPSEEEWADMADEVANLTGATPLFLPMQHPGDTEFCAKVAAKMKKGSTILRGPVAPGEMIGMIGRLRCLSAMRLHALIFSAMGGTPMLGHVYDPKVSEFMGEIGQSTYCAPLLPFDAKRLAGVLLEAMNEGDALRNDLLAQAVKLKARALTNADIALRLAKS